MEYNILEYNHIHIEYSRFKPENGITEYHAMLHVNRTNDRFEKQLSDIHNALSYLMNTFGTDVHPIFTRYFLSDIANQLSIVQRSREHYPPCAVSVVQQSPLAGGKVALWIYCKSDVETDMVDTFFTERHSVYRHLWSSGLIFPQGDPYMQTESLLQDYSSALEGLGCQLENNCVRTWLFVQHIDTDYQSIAQARKHFFAAHQLTEQTHYIASTGIEGRHADSRVYVQMDAYAIEGLQQSQLQYLQALSHLCPTHHYGITFERGVAIEYGDRTHIFISGTASINNRGEIVYPGDVAAQTRHLLENISMLLAEADAGFDDVACWIIYLRDMSDYDVVKTVFEERFSSVPKLITMASVCRQGWLVEAECVVVKENKNSRYAVL
jgi:enamine deaminase RidA (YjgF/YER057c/UK114 family)